MKKKSTKLFSGASLGGEPSGTLLSAFDVVATAHVS